MTYPVTDPVESGMLDVGDGHRVHWEVCGNPRGKPAVVLHGGPGSGAAPWWRGYFEPRRYRVVLFDQRGCGRSTPFAGEPVADLSANTTAHLVADIERLRTVLGIERWLVLGGSWGSTLGLAYAVQHPERVSELVLWAVVTTRRHEVDWLTWGMGNVFPEEFAAFRAALPDGERDDNLATAYHRLLMDPDPAVHLPASRAWVAWEDRIATLSGPVVPSGRFADDRFRLGFTRLVTHYFGNAAFLPDDGIVGRLHRIADVPAVLVRGRLDIASPLRTAWELLQQLPRAELHVIEGAGHGCGAEGDEVVVRATDRFAG